MAGGTAGECEVACHPAPFVAARPEVVLPARVSVPRPSQSFSSTGYACGALAGGFDQMPLPSPVGTTPTSAVPVWYGHLKTPTGSPALISDKMFFFEAMPSPAYNGGGPFQSVYPCRSPYGASAAAVSSQPLPAEQFRRPTPEADMPRCMYGAPGSQGRPVAPLTPNRMASAICPRQLPVVGGAPSQTPSSGARREAGHYVQITPHQAGAQAQASPTPSSVRLDCGRGVSHGRAASLQQTRPQERSCDVPLVLFPWPATCPTHAVGQLPEPLPASPAASLPSPSSILGPALTALPFAPPEQVSPAKPSDASAAAFSSNPVVLAAEADAHMLEWPVAVAPPHDWWNLLTGATEATATATAVALDKAQSSPSSKALADSVVLGIAVPVPVPLALVTLSRLPSAQSDTPQILEERPSTDVEDSSEQVIEFRSSTKSDDTDNANNCSGEDGPASAALKTEDQTHGPPGVSQMFWSFFASGEQPPSLSPLTALSEAASPSTDSAFSPVHLGPPTPTPSISPSGRERVERARLERFVSAPARRISAPPGFTEPELSRRLAKIGKRLATLARGGRAALVREEHESRFVEQIRQATEALLWGEMYDGALFDLFCEHQLLATFVIALQSTTTPSAVKVQLLQSLVILVQNARRLTSMFYLLSGGRLNSLFDSPPDFDNDEMLAYFVSLMKNLALNLGPETARLLLVECAPVGCAAGGGSRPRSRLPLFERCVRLADHWDAMVRTAARVAILSILKLSTPQVREAAVDAFCALLAPSLVGRLVQEPKACTLFSHPAGRGEEDAAEELRAFAEDLRALAIPSVTAALSACAGPPPRAGGSTSEDEESS